jgi:hypothetical protein
MPTNRTRRRRDAQLHGALIQQLRDGDSIKRTPENDKDLHWLKFFARWFLQDGDAIGELAGAELTRWEDAGWTLSETRGE